MKKESWNVSWILFSIAHKFLYKRSWAVIYLGCLLPNISCSSPRSEGEKDQPFFLRPCSLLGFTEPVPLDTAGALLPHLCTLTNVMRVIRKQPLHLAVFFCGTILAIARTGSYPASMVFWESRLSSNLSQGQICNHLANSLIYIV